MPPRRKRFDTLRPADIQSTPVWMYARFELHRTAASAVVPRPTCDRVVHDPYNHAVPSASDLLLATDFVLADGTTLPGLSQVGWRSFTRVLPNTVSAAGKDPTSILRMRPHLLSRAGPLPLFRSDGPFTREAMDSVYRAIGKSASQVFPLTFCSRVALDDEAFFGSALLPGFVARVESVRTFTAGRRHQAAAGRS